MKKGVYSVVVFAFVHLDELPYILYILGLGDLGPVNETMRTLGLGSGEEKDTIA